MWENWNAANTQAMNDEMSRTDRWKGIFCKDPKGLDQDQLFGWNRCFTDGGEVKEMERLRVNNPCIKYFAKPVTVWEVVQLDGESM